MNKTMLVNKKMTDKEYKNRLIEKYELGFFGKITRSIVKQHKKRYQDVVKFLETINVDK